MAHEFGARTETRGQDTGFDGIFDDTLRRRLRQKRAQCRLPIGQLCAILGVSPSTYRKWEAGKVSGCRFHNVRMVKMFLDGELDGQLTAQALYGGGMMPSISSGVELRMRSHFCNLMSMFSMLRQHPDREERIADNFIGYCDLCRSQVVNALGSQASDYRY